MPSCCKSMHRQLRRVRLAIRRQHFRNLIALISFGCTFLILVFKFYDECSHFGIFPVVIELDNCKPSTVKEKLNISLISDKFVLQKSLQIGSDLRNDSSLTNTASNRQKVADLLEFNKRLELKFNEFEQDQYGYVDMVFHTRKEQAKKACMDMLNVGLPKGNSTSIGSEEIPKLPANDSMILQRVVRKAIQSKQSFRYLLKNPKENLKYFQSTAPGKKNRWIHFHRIIKSPKPADSKIVEIKWCPVFKAASTPWLAVFTKLSYALTNYTEAAIKAGKLGFMELAKKFRLLTPTIYDQSATTILTKYNMIVVRHPFKRLLSAYRDKIERVKGRLYYYRKYSTKIIGKFRKGELGIIERDSKDKDYSVNVPTFEEFVHYVLSTDPRKLDEHWRPMFLDCSPCHHTFDFILKVETLDDDKQKVLKYLRLSQLDPQYKEVEDAWTRWNNPSGKNEPHRNESYYYSQLLVQDIKKLVDLYEPDFRFFGYSPDVYMLMGRKNSKHNHV